MEAAFTIVKAEVVEDVPAPQTVRREYGVEVPMPTLPVAPNAMMLTSFEFLRKRVLGMKVPGASLNLKPFLNIRSPTYELVARSVPSTCKLFCIVEVPVPPMYISPETANVAEGVVVPIPTLPPAGAEDGVVVLSYTPVP